MGCKKRNGKLVKVHYKTFRIALENIQKIIKELQKSIENSAKFKFKKQGKICIIRLL